MDYPQEPKVYPGERIPTIPDDSVPENQNQPELKMPDYKKSMAWFERCCNDRVVEADKFLEDHQAAQSISSIRLNQGRDMIPRLEGRFSKLDTVSWIYSYARTLVLLLWNDDLSHMKSDYKKSYVAKLLRH